jgi:hypothetical protein
LTRNGVPLNTAKGTDVATIGEITDLDVRAIEQAKRWYAEQPMPDTFAHVPSVIRRRAHRMAGGDWRRIVLDQDGVSLVVHDQIMWQYERAC